MITDDFGAALQGLRGFPVLFLNQVTASIAMAFMVSFLVLFFTLLLRRNWLGIAAAWLVIFIFAVLDQLTGERALSGIIWSLLLPTFFVLTTARFGVLAMLSALVFYHLIVFYPITTELSAWYAADFVVCIIVPAALAIYGFHTSLAGQPIFEGRLLKDEG